MSVGVFGKLPARRDYVLHGVDAGLMKVFDPWLQHAVAASRKELGEAWLGTYLKAPIWRFWLGHAITGRPALGALMPSVDGVGRYFPLAILGSFDHALAPPEIDEHADWFAAAEPLLLAALADDAKYEALLDGLANLPAPAAEVRLPEDGAGLRGMFATLRHAHAREVYGRFSCWWVPSPDDGETPPRALMRRGMPAPMDYAAMIAQDRETQPAPAPGGA